MAGFAFNVTIGGVLVILAFAGRIEAGQLPSPPTLPPNSPPPRIMAPYVVCGMTILPVPPQVDARMVKPVEPNRRGLGQAVPLIRRVPPRTCTTASARPRIPDDPRTR